MELALETWALSFLAGLYTPLGAVCVIPMYPAFIAFLAGKSGTEKSERIHLLGIAVTIGVLASMFFFGLIFVFILQISASMVIGIIGPIIYAALALMSIGMILGYDIGRIFPVVNTPSGSSPLLTAILFGAFFGLIALPCNPASIILLFALSATTADFMANFANFVLFGIGMATPLLVLSFLPINKSQFITKFLTRRHLLINRIAGVLMLWIALYYLIYVFLMEYL